MKCWGLFLRVLSDLIVVVILEEYFRGMVCVGCVIWKFDIYEDPQCWKLDILMFGV